MNDATRPRRRERANRSAGIRQLPFARFNNPYRPMELVSADQIESIHQASLKLLAEVGVEVMHEESRRILRQAGADVDEATQRVRCDPAMIEAEIAKAPSSFTILTRDPAKSIVLGEGEVVFSSVGGPAFANDLIIDVDALDFDFHFVRLQFIASRTGAQLSTRSLQATWHSPFRVTDHSTSADRECLLLAQS